MTDEKIIEEMAKCIPNDIVRYDGMPSGQHLYIEQKEEIAKELYEQNYRKILKDSVVISQEEYDALKLIEGYHIKSCGKGAVILTETERITMCAEQWSKGYAQARKETAKEFYTKLLWFGVKRTGQTTADSYIQISLERLQKLIKECGVEVKE